MSLLKKNIKTAWLVVMGFFMSVTANAFNQPPTNFSATTFLDAAPPGLYYMNYFLFIDGNKAVDKSGETIPGNGRVNAITQLNQIAYVSPVRFLGANVGGEVVVPVVAATGKGSVGPNLLTNNTAGVGDLVVGPFLMWYGKLFDKPLMQRFELDFIFPTGKYDKNMAINPGANLHGIEPYYSFVWMFSDRWETSWRLFYMKSSENKDTHIKPGDLFHLNYAVSYSVLPKLRVGAAGYMLTQLSEDEFNGVKLVDSKEKAMAVGPGLVYMGQGFTMMLSHPVEFGVRNRFQGSRTTLQIIHKF